MKTEDLAAKLKSCDENAAQKFLHKYIPLIIYVITPILENLSNSKKESAVALSFFIEIIQNSRLFHQHRR